MTKWLKLIARRVAFLKPVLEPLAEMECRLARCWAAGAHWRLLAVQWGFPPQPEYFDHHVDLYYQWLRSRSSMWVERGVFGSLALQGGEVLELACGDGFYTRNFYSLRSRSVIACDFDPNAITRARRKNGAPNVTFVLADIRTAMPTGKFANVVWDAAIEHFTPQEIQDILCAIKERVGDSGILSGYTIVERSDGVLSLPQHEHEFESKEELVRFLAPYFAHVTVFETVYPERHNLYFWASDGIIPFDEHWPYAVYAGRDVESAQGGQAVASEPADDRSGRFIPSRPLA